MQNIDMGKIADVLGKIMATADFSVFKNAEIDSAEVFYKIVQNQQTEINLKIKLNPRDENVEIKLQEILKIMLAFVDAEKIKIHKVI